MSNKYLAMETNDSNVVDIVSKLPELKTIKDIKDLFAGYEKKEDMVLVFRIENKESMDLPGIGHLIPEIRNTLTLLETVGLFTTDIIFVETKDKDLEISIDVSNLYKKLKVKFGLYTYDEILKGATDEQLIEHFTKINHLRRAILRKTTMIERVNESPNPYYGVIPFDGSVYVACYYGTPSCIWTPLGYFKFTGGGSCNGMSAEEIFDSLNIKYTKVKDEEQRSIGTYGAVYRIDVDHLGNKYPEGNPDEIIISCGTTEATTQYEHRASYDEAKATFNRIHKAIPDLLIEEEELYERNTKYLEVVEGVHVKCTLSNSKLVSNPNFMEQFKAGGKFDIEYWVNEVCEKGLEWFVPDCTGKIHINQKGMVVKTPGKYYDKWEDIPVRTRRDGIQD